MQDNRYEKYPPIIAMLIVIFPVPFIFEHFIYEIYADHAPA